MHFSFSETGYPGHPTHDISLNFTPIGEGLWPLRSKCYRHLKLYLTILFGLCLSLVMSVLRVQQKRSPSRKSLTINSKRLINKQSTRLFGTISNKIPNTQRDIYKNNIATLKCKPTFVVLLKTDKNSRGLKHIWKGRLLTRKRLHHKSNGTRSFHQQNKNKNPSREVFTDYKLWIACKQSGSLLTTILENIANTVENR